jgi:DNA-binding Lrp family transcriptional regulator
MWWGTTDPRLSVREVARRLRVDPNTISNRLRKWQSTGFLLGYSVVPNPTLLGARLAGGSVRIPSARSKEGFFRDFGLIEGAAFAVDQVGPWVVVMFVYSTERGLRRSELLTRKLEGVTEMDPCIPFRCPATRATPKTLDWRILRTIHARPSADITQWSTELGVAPKTFTRRYKALTQDRAVWSIPRFDFTRYRGGTVCRVIIRMSANLEIEGILGRLENTFPSFIVIEDQTDLPDTKMPPGQLISLLLQLPTAGQLDDLERVLREVPGVIDVESFILRCTYVYEDWFEERLEVLAVSKSSHIG